MQELELEEEEEPPAGGDSEGEAATAALDAAGLREAVDLAHELLLSQSTLPCECSTGAALTAAWTTWARGVGSSSCSGRTGPATSEPTEGEERPPGRAAPPHFRVDLCRGGGRRCFGLACAGLPMGGGEGVLLVTGIDPGSCTEAWNDRCAQEREPWRRLHLYTAILAVSGVTGDVRRMQQVLETCTSAELLACSPPTLLAAASALLAVRDAAPLDREGPFWAAALRELAPASATDGGHGVRELDGNAAEEREGGAAEAADVTVIITTSPVPSNPCTEMLRGVLSGLALVPGLANAPRILVCDGFTLAQPGHKPRHKAGKIERGDDERYAGFLRDVSACVARANAEPGCGSRTPSPFARLQVLELAEHHGFAFAVKRALQEVRTRFVMVVQHDQEIVRPFDVTGVLEAMRRHPDRVKYVGLCGVTTYEYDHMVLSKYGLRVSGTSEFGIPLMPLLFFYDKPHICSVQHYRDVVFGPRSPIRQGDFIEDTLGQAQRSDILQNGMAAHAKYGTFQLDERNERGEPVIAVRHVNGRSFWSPEQRAARGWPAHMSFWT